jgi:predicted O-methyltransferase YrrM
MRNERNYELQITNYQFELIGPAAAWLSVQREGEEIILRPKEPLPCRCTIRPAALFQQDRGFPDVNTVMGRLTFPRGATEPQRYRPYTRDPHRHLRVVFLPVETMPDDDWFASPTRWRNNEAIARRLLHEACIPWNGLAEGDVEELVRFVVWPEPLEGCVLHALTQWSAGRGECVIEIGSFRGRSLTMLAMALRGAERDSLLLSVDPHEDEPHNHAHCRLALAQIGEEKRLVSFACQSDRAFRVLRPSSASLVFVDGNHSFAQVVADFENYRRLVAPGGCIVFHDYGYGNHNGRPEADPEVRPAIDEHVMAAEDFRPMLLAHTLFAFQRKA